MGNFYTDVIEKDPRFHSLTPIHDTGLLEPRFRAAVIGIIAEAKVAGTTLVILETYRSQARQAELYAQGATQLQRVGCHGYGLACDLGISIGGQVNWKADYSVLQALAAKYRVVWGGDWAEPSQPHSFRDYDHVQGIDVADQPKLFSGTWYPDAAYVPSEVG